MTTRISTREIDNAISEFVVPHWQDTRNSIGGKINGWSRTLRDPGGVGTVATSQALIAQNILQQPSDGEAMACIADRQLEDGSWSFEATLTEQGVVDATAWVILALKNTNEFHDEVRRGVSWLLEVADDGWGICARQQFRVYSTSMAIRALVAVGEGDQFEVSRGMRRLFAEFDRNVGAWKDASMKPSAAVTCQAMLAATAFSQQNHKKDLDLAVSWLLDMADQTQLWSSGPNLGREEEVTVRNGSPRKVQYGHCSRSLIVRTLFDLRRFDDPRVCRALAEIVSDTETESWILTSGGGELETSWVLHDLSACLASARRALFLQTPSVSDVIVRRKSVYFLRENASKTVAFFQLHRWVVLTVVAVVTTVLAVSIILAFAEPTIVKIAGSALTVVLIPFLVSLAASYVSRNSMPPAMR